MASRVADCLKTLIHKPSMPKKQSTYFGEGSAAVEVLSCPTLLVLLIGLMGTPCGESQGDASGAARWAADRGVSIHTLDGNSDSL